MRYQYNPETCRYEPVPFRISTIAIPVLILLAVSAIIFVVLLLLHSSYITTDREIALKNENRLLAVHYENIKTSYAELNNSIQKLHQQDNLIQEQLIAAKFNERENKTSVRKITDENTDWKSFAAGAQKRAKYLLQHSSYTNQYLASVIHFDQDSKTMLANLPTAFPIESISFHQVASGFGSNTNPWHKATYKHNGIDFIAPSGTPVLATASGKVVYSKKDDLPVGDGYVIEIDHGNGFRTRYSHLGSLEVKSGMKVSKGQVIAYVGMSGSSVAPHLHYEIHNNHEPIDPAIYIMENLSSSAYARWLDINKRRNQSLD